MAGAVSSNNLFVECGTCGKGFESDAKCDSHLAKVCDLGSCNHKEFGRSYELKRHINSVHNSTGFVCNISPCDNQTFSRKDNFQRHERFFHGMR